VCVCVCVCAYVCVCVCVFVCVHYVCARTLRACELACVCARAPVLGIL